MTPQSFDGQIICSVYGRKQNGKPSFSMRSMVWAAGACQSNFLVLHEQIFLQVYGWISAVEFWPHPLPWNEVCSTLLGDILLKTYVVKTILWLSIFPNLRFPKCLGYREIVTYFIVESAILEPKFNFSWAGSVNFLSPFEARALFLACVGCPWYPWTHILTCTNWVTDPKLIPNPIPQYAYKKGG